ncbi:Armet protein [Trypanosoma melophagium]|uniref:Armet protein n=1 Tax=Trypanosoma melophagium TaxID=715481 RepID=UPI00351A5968|nr:Armet protein [Trypanosoma melophagium]
MRNILSTPLLLLVLLLLSIECLTATAEMTEQDFKSMKIKDLRKFLEERDLSCPGCQEKADFVRIAFQNRDKKPVSEQGKRDIPNAPLWKVWKDNAKAICTEVVTKRGLDLSGKPQADICDAMAYVAESFFMQHGKRTANKLRKKAEDLLKTSYKSVYYDAGRLLLEKLANYCFASPSNQEKCSSVGSLTSLMEGTSVIDLVKWMTNVGIENTNPMYEILEQRDDL